MQETRTKIDKISALEENWGDGGELPIKPEVIHACMLLIDWFVEYDIVSPITVAPSPDGSVLFLWGTTNSYAILEIDDEVEVTAITPEGDFIIMNMENLELPEELKNLLCAGKQ